MCIIYWAKKLASILRLQSNGLISGWLIRVLFCKTVWFKLAKWISSQKLANMFRANNRNYVWDIWKNSEAHVALFSPWYTWRLDTSMPCLARVDRDEVELRGKSGGTGGLNTDLVKMRRSCSSGFKGCDHQPTPLKVGRLRWLPPLLKASPVLSTSIRGLVCMCV